MTLGGRRVAVKRPRARTADGEQEVPLATYEYFADRDPLTRVVLEQMLAGVSTRRFSRTREPVGEEVTGSERSASKSVVSREFIGRTREHLDALMSRDLADVRLAALMVDGIEVKGRCAIVALGISTDGVKLPLGLWEGSTENKTVTAHLLADLVGRASTSSKASSSSWTAARHSERLSMRSSARCQCSAAFGIRKEMCWIISPSATGPQ